LYANDENNIIRRSYENPAINLLYKEYLDRPLSERSEELLHTKYTKRGV
jgi:iron only hydrogenase large subunit-like protein